MLAAHILTLALATGVLGHMEMMQPYALRSKYDPANKQSGNIDYSMTSPLEATGSNFPCKGYQNDRPIRTVATYQAGSNYTVKLAGTATHDGGSCQLSLSYDNGKTFRVIKSMIGGCPLQDSYDFQIPSYAPAGTALLGWTWVNLVGNREYYMNCAEVEIQGGSRAQSPMQRRHLHRHLRQKRDASSSFESLPTIWRANMPSVNDCTTQEGKQVVYPHPGPDVVYGSGMSSSSPPTDGTCDGASPPGPTYKDLSTDGATSAGQVSPGPGSGGTAAAGSSATGPWPSAGAGMQPKKGSPFGAQPVNSDPDAALSSMSLAPLPAQPSTASSPAQAAASPTLPLTPPTPSDSSSSNSTGSIGSCDIIVGGLKCLRNGQGFAVCSEGQWVDMGDVSGGTSCQNGVIGAISGAPS